jgi:hypothetical protein
VIARHGCPAEHHSRTACPQLLHHHHVLQSHPAFPSYVLRARTPSLRSSCSTPCGPRVPQSKQRRSVGVRWAQSLVLLSSSCVLLPLIGLLWRSRETRETRRETRETPSLPSIHTAFPTRSVARSACSRRAAFSLIRSCPSSALQRLDRQADTLGDQAHFLLVNCAPSLSNHDVAKWGERRRLQFIQHFKLLGPAPKYRPSNQKASLIIQSLARGYLARKYNK